MGGRGCVARLHTWFCDPGPHGGHSGLLSEASWVHLGFLQAKSWGVDRLGPGHQRLSRKGSLDVGRGAPSSYAMPVTRGHPALSTQVQACFLLLATLPSPGPGRLCPPRTVRRAGPLSATLGMGPSEASKQTVSDRQNPCSQHTQESAPSACPPRSVAKSNWALPPPHQAHRGSGVLRRAPARPDRGRGRDRLSPPPAPREWPCSRA